MTSQTPDQALCKHDLALATCADCTPAPGFGPIEMIKVSDLALGDWVESFPAQRRIRGCLVQSGVKTIGPSVHQWFSQSRPRGPRMPVQARRITFLMSPTVLDIPSECDIRVRRPQA